MPFNLIWLLVLTLGITAVTLVAFVNQASGTVHFMKYIFRYRTVWNAIDDPFLRNEERKSYLKPLFKDIFYVVCLFVLLVWCLVVLAMLVALLFTLPLR
jgi:hypothetical protein